MTIPDHTSTFRMVRETYRQSEYHTPVRLVYQHILDMVMEASSQGQDTVSSLPSEWPVTLDENRWEEVVAWLVKDGFTACFYYQDRARSMIGLKVTGW